MILGIGTDLCNIERIAQTLERFGDRFRSRVFTETEIAKAERRADAPGTYAKRWAAKEACSGDDPDKAIVILLWDSGGKYDTRFFQAGMKLSEAVALLEVQKARMTGLMEAGAAG